MAFLAAISALSLTASWFLLFAGEPLLTYFPAAALLGLTVSTTLLVLIELVKAAFRR